MRRRQGFTIIELLVVIAVIGILAAIVIVSYTGWRHTTTLNQVKSDLVQASSAMEASKNFGSGYPSTLPTTFTPTSGSSIVLTSSTPTSYCIDGTATTDATIQLYVDSSTASGGVQTGTCAGRTVSPTAPATPTGLSVGSSTGTTVNLTWSASTGASSYTAQCSPDSSYVVGAQQVVATIASGTVTGLTTNSTEYCRVNATSAGGTSAWSASVTTNTAAS